MKRLLYIFLTLLTAAACGTGGEFSRAERSLICGKPEDGVPPGTMRVLTIDDKADSIVLRRPCRTLSEKALRSMTYRKLAEQMLSLERAPRIQRIWFLLS